MSKTFTSMSETENCLMIVDSLNLAFRWKHSGTTDFYLDYLRTIDSLKRSYKAKYVIITADMGSSSYRKALYPDYKQNRKELYKDQTDAEKAAFELFLEDYSRSLEHIQENTDYPIIRFKGVEADDIAAYITSCSESLPIDETWLISTDKDWDLLLKDNIHRFSYVTRKEYTLNNWNQHHEFPHEQYISIKCLMGDAGDNVIGVEGIGPKRAAQLVEKYGSALDIVAHLPISSNLKFMKALNASSDKIMLNYLLMDLVSFCSDALGDNTKIIDEIIKEYIK